MVVSLATSLLAQNRMSVSGRPAPSGAPQHTFAPAIHRTSIGISGIPFGFRHRGFGRFGLLYWPYVSPGYYPDYYESDYQAPPPPPAPEQPAAAPQAKQETTPEPALLELQGSQWVKVNSFTMSAVPAPQVSAATAKEMPPAVLVYRDGHTEELTSYSIIGNAIYTKADYWSSGLWTRTIQIADLDVPATLKQNQQRGVKFELPSGPGEVMIRP